LTPSNIAILERARTFGAEVIEPAAENWERLGSVPRDYFTRAAAAGLCRLLVPAEQGGLGLAGPAYVDVAAALARHCLASTFAVVVHNNLAAALARDGSPALRARHLDAMLRGERIGAFLLTEPGVGSDAAAIATTATRDGDHWVLNGAKAWISNAVNADVLAVYAQTVPGSGARGVVCLLVEAASPGVHREAPYALLGGHALGTGGFTFHECRVPADSVLQAPGAAFAAALRGIDLARVTVAGMCCGMLGRALEEALGYVAARPAFGRTVAEFQGVQWLLADVATELEAARALAARAAALLGGTGATLAAAHAKKYATRVALARIADCMQVMGAAGLRRDRPLARHLAAAKIAQYLDGATEIQNVVIARHLFGMR